MEQKILLTKKELAARWGCTPKYIDNLRAEGVISTVKGLPAPRFNIQHILEIEETKIESFSPLERRRLEREIQALREENQQLKGVLSNILAESSKVINLR
ncbi:histidine kinase [Clostridium perfringens]|uniref:histidine kinase n=1 Tax=Clostridium perfringens TaxID=1502 RepID=UPI0018E3FD53|nr:histidine kinase [Clostridium perfringens]MBI6110907.1 histidine kinase [Clostridium perfringens]MBI6112953.1 histidine kinase [Clostridium perfringens]